MIITLTVAVGQTFFFSYQIQKFIFNLCAGMELLKA